VTNPLRSIALDRIGPTIEFAGGGTVGNLKDTIAAIDARITRTKKSMRTIRIMLSNQSRMDCDLLEEYQGLNEQLRALEIFKVEFRYNRRMI
jgi:hypothetical protein